MDSELRTRMITLRLTHHEYERFHKLCIAGGHGTVSEMVRTAVNQMITNNPPDIPLKPRSEIPVRIAALESHVFNLAETVTQMKRRIETLPAAV